MRMTLNILKRSNDFEFVEEIAGDYTGTNHMKLEAIVIDKRILLKKNGAN
jgi:hypothetical protein